MGRVYIVVDTFPEGEGRRVCAVSMTRTRGVVVVLDSFEAVSDAPLSHQSLANINLAHNFTEWVKGQGKPITWICPTCEADFGQILFVLHNLGRGKINIEVTRTKVLKHLRIAETPFLPLIQYPPVSQLIPDFDPFRNPLGMTEQWGRLHLTTKP